MGTHDALFKHAFSDAEHARGRRALVGLMRDILGSTLWLGRTSSKGCSRVARKERRSRRR